MKIYRISSDDNYFYHGTPPQNIDSIREYGLSIDYSYEYPHGNQDIDDSEKRLYFSDLKHYYNQQFGGINRVNLRVKKEDIIPFAKTIHRFNGDEIWYFGPTISPEKIEIEINGAWLPLSSQEQDTYEDL